MCFFLVPGGCHERATEGPEPADEPVEDTTAPSKAPVQPLFDRPYTRVRRPAVAGSWYSGDGATLSAEINTMLDGAGGFSQCTATPLALVVPHAGYRFSGPTAAAAINQARGCNIRRVWVLAPSHHLALRGVGLYDVEAFRTPMGDLPLDQDVLDRLLAQPGFGRIPPSGDGGEHALEIELPILQGALGAFELVPLLVGQVDLPMAERLSAAIRPELGPGDLVVVSSDFTHFGPRFGYRPFDTDVPARLSALDHAAWAHLAHPDPTGLSAMLAETGATICGRHPLTILAALVGEGATGTEVKYTTSGELTGDWANSVSYLAGRLDGPAWSGRGPSSGTARLVPPDTATALRDLAERALHHWYEHGEMLEVDPLTLPAGADTVLGAFVTLTRGDDLRGCIGEIVPTRPAWKAVVERVLDAALHDSRFRPVTAKELPEIEVEISLLGPARTVPGPSAFIVGRHGIVLTLGSRRATFLPQVAPEQAWDRSQTLAQLARKAGIPANAIDRATVEVYEAQVAMSPHHREGHGEGGR